ANDGIAPWRVATQGSDGLPIDRVERWRAGTILCFSSAKRKKVICKKGLGVRAIITGLGRMLDIRYPFVFDDGDSGAPVWNFDTGAAVGLVSGHYDGHGYIAPLLRPKGMDEDDNERAPGILRAPGMGSLQLLKVGE
ncbi:MAG TPA: hypothetical protein VK889_05960, partial [Solirubrobacterales bacterium]|nr:hypothetical protein [Solirubrobacterales bacterium]